MEKLEEKMIKKIFQDLRDNLQNMITMEIALKTDYLKEKQKLKISISELSDSDVSKNDYFSPRSSIKTSNRNELLIKSEELDDNIKLCNEKLENMQRSLEDLEVVEKFTYDAYQDYVKANAPDEESIDTEEGEKAEKIPDIEETKSETVENPEEKIKKEIENRTEQRIADEDITFSTVKKNLKFKTRAIQYKIDLISKLFQTDKIRTGMELEKLSQQAIDLENYVEALDDDALDPKLKNNNRTLYEEKDTKEKFIDKTEQPDSKWEREKEAESPGNPGEESIDKVENPEKTAEAFLSEWIEDYNASLKDCHIDYSIEGEEKDIKDKYAFLKNILHTSLFNSHKIKRAKEILVKLIFLDEKWKLFILDDGMAYTKEELKYDRVQKRKLHYKEIKKDVEYAKGEFKLESIEGEGTTICIIVPYSS